MGADAAQARRILIVEDEPLIVMLLSDMLAELGCQVAGSAGTVAEALRLVEGEAFDAALLDIGLADECGYQVADALAEHGIPFALMSGMSGPPRPPHQDRSLLTKPFAMGDLERAIDALLGR